MKQLLAILTLFGSLTFTSCEDFLTEKVRGQQNLDTYFTTMITAPEGNSGDSEKSSVMRYYNIDEIPEEYRELSPFSAFSNAINHVYKNTPA
jgi:hypothetical protein